MITTYIHVMSHVYGVHDCAFNLFISRGWIETYPANVNIYHFPLFGRGRNSTTPKIPGGRRQLFLWIAEFASEPNIDSY